MEVIYDLDEEASNLAKELGMTLRRTPTSSQDPRFAAMIRELVLERRGDIPTRTSLGVLGPSHDVCPVDCCTPPPARPAR
jgi:ferrochelatase